MKQIAVLSILFWPLLSLAQAELDSTEKAKVLIIPFEEKLFYCDIMRDLTEANQMSKQEIFHRFRNEVQLSLKAALKDSMDAASFHSSDSLKHDELVNIYQVLGYDFVPVPVVEEKGENGKKKKVQEPAPKREVGVRNGEVIAERQVVERYMSAKLKSPEVLQQLHSNYGFNRFVFINQMDVKMDLTDPETAFLDPKRLVAIHYTIMDKDGKEINGGLASAQFPGTESRLNYIIGGNFYKLSAEVLSSLITAEKKEAEAEEKGNRKSKTRSE
ncbi:MAG: hypothetical protein EP314_05590 [Bacteroidetes bacterium]|nr:MAG: hypothetical protein EP314_05590 [Bacteroidota bacterium]